MDDLAAPITQTQYWASQGGWAAAFMVTSWYLKKAMDGREQAAAIMVQVAKDCAAAMALQAASNQNLVSVVQAFHARFDRDMDTGRRGRRTEVN
jgi:hypothetical protein